MKILHWVKKENSGLFRTTLELAKYEERQGHQVALRIPADNTTFYGSKDDDFDLHAIHSQINPRYYKDGKPKVLFLHGEPDYGMLVKVSIKAILDLAPLCDAFISFNSAESRIWQSFKNVYTITKGIDLDSYKPTNTGKKLAGSPSIAYGEHWRQFRHPMHVFAALDKVYEKLPNMRFYPFGCPPDEKEFWLNLIRQNKHSVYTPGIFQRQNKMSNLFNVVDMVVSPVFPSYGRVSLEAMACGKPVVAYNTNPHADYKCRPYDPDDMAEKIIQCWEEKKGGQREYAEDNFDAGKMAREAIEIYKRLV